MKVIMDLNEEETRKLWHITRSASRELKKPYNIATVCLNIIRAYLDDHVIEYIPDEGGKG